MKSHPNHIQEHGDAGNNSKNQVNSQNIALCEYVRIVIDRYFQQIDGYPIGNLHELVITEVEKPLIETVMKHLGHNQTKAAKTLGISRSTLRTKMDRYGLE